MEKKIRVALNEAQYDYVIKMLYYEFDNEFLYQKVIGFKTDDLNMLLSLIISVEQAYAKTHPYSNFSANELIAKKIGDIKEIEELAKMRRREHD